MQRIWAAALPGERRLVAEVAGNIEPARRLDRAEPVCVVAHNGVLQLKLWLFGPRNLDPGVVPAPVDRVSE